MQSERSWSWQLSKNTNHESTVRFDALGLVTATNVWVDGCELQDQLSGEYVTPDIIPPGWEVRVFFVASETMVLTET